MTIAPARINPVAYGPTWLRGADGKFVLSEWSLANDAIDWAEKWLIQPDGPDAGGRWKFTAEQKRFLWAWYAVDRAGRFIYRYGMLRRMKGWGKDPFAAVIACIELLGPCRFVEWAQDYPVSGPHYAACIQIAAVSLDQAKRNTMSLFPQLFSRELIADHDIDDGKVIIWANRGRSRIELLTSSSRSAEGPRPTFIIKNESQHWLPSNGGDEMSEVCARNAAKSRDGATRVLAISNAHAPGEGSDAEKDWEAFRIGTPDMLYDSLEAPLEVSPKDDAEIVKAALEACRGDSYWLDVERLVAEIRDPRTQTNTARRFYLNQLAASEERAFDMERWKELVRSHYQVAQGSLVTGGFDGSVNDDWTVLMATEVATGYQWPIGIWKPVLGEDGRWRIDKESVKAAVEGFFESFDVNLLGVDPYYWTEEMESWMGRYNESGKIRVREFNTTTLKTTAKALLAYWTAIQEGLVSHPNSPDFNSGIENSYRRQEHFTDDNGDPLWTIRKERPQSPLKIDPAMAGCISWWARAVAIANGALNQNDWHGIYLGEMEEPS